MEQAHAVESPWISKMVFFWAVGILTVAAGSILGLHTHSAKADKELVKAEYGHIREQMDAAQSNLQIQINGVTKEIEKLDKKMDKFEERGDQRHREILKELRRHDR